MADTEHVNILDEAIDICAEGTGIDLVITDNGTDNIIICCDATQAIRIPHTGSPEKLLQEDLEQLYKSHGLIINRDIGEEKLSILGKILYKWDKTGCPVSPLLVTQLVQ